MEISGHFHLISGLRGHFSGMHPKNPFGLRCRNFMQDSTAISERRNDALLGVSGAPGNPAGKRHAIRSLRASQPREDSD